MTSVVAFSNRAWWNEEFPLAPAPQMPKAPKLCLTKEQVAYLYLQLEMTYPYEFRRLHALPAVDEVNQGTWKVVSDACVFHRFDWHLRKASRNLR